MHGARSAKTGVLPSASDAGRLGHGPPKKTTHRPEHARAGLAPVAWTAGRLGAGVPSMTFHDAMVPSAPSP
jgi:hypothetical protein